MKEKINYLHAAYILEPLNKGCWNWLLVILYCVTL